MKYKVIITTLSNHLFFDFFTITAAIEFAMAAARNESVDVTIKFIKISKEEH